MAYARAYVIRGASVLIGATEYDDQVTKARLVPDTPTQTLRTFGGVDKDRDQTSWTLELSGHQDRGTGGLADALDDAVAAGGTLTITLQPKSGAGQDKAVVTVVPVPVEFGGEAGNWKLFEVELEVVDQPTFSQSS